MDLKRLITINVFAFFVILIELCFQIRRKNNNTEFVKRKFKIIFIVMLMAIISSLVDDISTELMMFIFVLKIGFSCIKNRKNNGDLKENKEKEYVFYSLMLGIFICVLLSDIVVYINTGQADMKQLLNNALRVQMCIIIMIGL